MTPEIVVHSTLPSHTSQPDTSTNIPKSWIGRQFEPNTSVSVWLSIFHSGIITLWGCGRLNSSYFNCTNFSHFITTTNRLPTINGLRRPLSRILGTLGFSSTGQIGILPILIFLFRAIRLFTVWTSSSHIIKYRQLPLLIPELLLKHSSFWFPFYIVAASPWFGLSSWLGGLPPSIYVVAHLRTLYFSFLLRL